MPLVSCATSPKIYDSAMPVGDHVLVGELCIIFVSFCGALSKCSFTVTYNIGIISRQGPYAFQANFCFLNAIDPTDLRF